MPDETDPTLKDLQILKDSSYTFEEHRQALTGLLTEPSSWFDDANLMEYTYSVARVQVPRLLQGAGLSQDAIEPLEMADNAVMTLFSSASKIEKDTSFPEWVWGVIRNQTKDYIKRNWNFLAAVEIPASQQSPELLTEDERTEQELKYEAALDKLHRAVDSLEPIYRVVVQLHVFEHFTLAEIARELGLAYGTVRQRWSRAMKKLEELLGAD
jgi:RNA polymerase sigma factor (sigma-70 family)